MGAAVPKPEDHLSISKVAEDKPQEPVGDFESNKDPHDDVVVHFVEGFGPVSKKIKDSFGLVWVVSFLQDEIDGGDECMRAGCSWNCKLSRIIILGDVMYKTFYRICSLQKKTLEGFVQKLS